MLRSLDHFGGRPDVDEGGLDDGLAVAVVRAAHVLLRVVEGGVLDGQGAVAVHGHARVPLQVDAVRVLK